MRWHVPSPVPHSSKNFFSAAVIGRSSLVGMQYLPNVFFFADINKISLYKCKYDRTRLHEVAPSPFLLPNAAQWTFVPASTHEHRQLQNRGNRERQNEGYSRISFGSQYHVLHAVMWGYQIEHRCINRRLPTFKDGLRADGSIWEDTHGCQYLAWTFTIQITFSPFGLKTIGSPVALQTLCRIVVLPALARPITRMRNWVNFACIFSICSVLNWGFEVDIARLIWWYGERFKVGCDYCCDFGGCHCPAFPRILLIVQPTAVAFDFPDTTAFTRQKPLETVIIISRPRIQ